MPVAPLRRAATSLTAPPIAYAWFRKNVFQVRTHLALGKDTPLGRAVQRCGVIVAFCKPIPVQNAARQENSRRSLRIDPEAGDVEDAVL